MQTRLFDIKNSKVVPTEHCYTLKFLKDIMDEYPDEFMQIYAYLFYMSCPNPDLNRLSWKSKILSQPLAPFNERIWYPYPSSLRSKCF